MVGDDLSRIAGYGIKTHDELIAEAEEEITQMASALCGAIAALYDLDIGDGIVFTVLTDKDRMEGVILSPADLVDDVPVARFSVEIDDSETRH